MLLISSFSLSFFFLFLAHSTLLYFYVEKNLGNEVPLKEALLPWPEQGRLVGGLCLFLAATFLIVGIRGSTSYVGMGAIEWKVVSIFAGFPAAWYCIYFIRRIRNKAVGMQFSATQSTKAEVLAPLLFAVVVSLLGLFTN